MSSKVRAFSLLRYIDAALALAEYDRDEDGVVIAIVPNVSGFFAQGDSFEEARANLRDAIEGNVLLALQLGLPIPAVPGVAIEEQDAVPFFIGMQITKWVRSTIDHLHKENE